jgi:putative oxidoreductase
MGSVARGEKMKQTSNPQRPTLNVEASERGSDFEVRRWKLDVGRLLFRLLEFTVGAVFIYAGVLKALAPIGFANDIENYHILPWPIGVRLAFYLPWLEILCGIALWLRRATHGALGILGTLTFVFIVATIVAKARGIDVSCGCFGHAARSLSFASHLAIDFVILAAITAVMLRPKRQP